MLEREVRVLVADDSALVRSVLSRALEAVPGIVVCGRAQNGREAVEMTRELRPDVVTMDVEMPEMNGIEAVSRIMTDCPTPILMVSSLTTEGGQITAEALEAGALDFVPKPERPEEFRAIGAVVAEKVLQLAERGRLALGAARGHRPLWRRVREESTPPLVVIGASTGGPRALFAVVPMLPEGFGAPVVIVQHMPPGFTRPLAERLGAAGPLPCGEAAQGDVLTAGRIIMARAGNHLEVHGRVVELSDSPPRHGVRPALDVTLLSAAAFYPGPVVAVVLTGMGRDGAEGALAVRERGGRVIAESERTALIYGMPQAVVRAGAADLVAGLGDVADGIVRFCGELLHAG